MAKQFVDKFKVTNRNDGYGMAKPIRGEIRPNWKPDSKVSITKTGKVRVTHMDKPSCRNLTWQRTNYERCMQTGEWAPKHG